jgi:nucleoid-associated protein YgaU
MPAEMRLSHLPEIVLSLVMFAGLAVSVLGFGRERARASVGPAPVTSR